VDDTSPGVIQGSVQLVTGLPMQPELTIPVSFGAVVTN